MIKKYQKKPVVIEAIQWDGIATTFNLIINQKKFNWKPGDMGSCTFYIQTLEGFMKVSKGDYIIKGIQGEYYSCKPDIFKQTYEAVDNEV